MPVLFWISPWFLYRHYAMVRDQFFNERIGIWGVLQNWVYGDIFGFKSELLAAAFRYRSQNPIRPNIRTNIESLAVQRLQYVFDISLPFSPQNTSWALSTNLPKGVDNWQLTTNNWQLTTDNL